MTGLLCTEMRVSGGNLSDTPLTRANPTHTSSLTMPCVFSETQCNAPCADAVMLINFLKCCLQFIFYLISEPVSF